VFFSSDLNLSRYIKFQIEFDGFRCWTDEELAAEDELVPNTCLSFPWIRFSCTLIPFLLEDLKGQLEHWKPRDMVWVFIPPLFELFFSSSLCWAACSRLCSGSKVKKLHLEPEINIYCSFII